MQLNVREAAKKVGMSPHTVRYYTNMNLVPSLKYDEHGNRLFDGSDLNWLQCARFLRESGMPISQVRHYFSLCQQGDATIQERFEILLALQEQTEKELESLQKRAACSRLIPEKSVFPSFTPLSRMNRLPFHTSGVRMILYCRFYFKQGRYFS